MIRLITHLFAGLLLGAPVDALELAGVTLVDQVRPAGSDTTLVLNGAGIRSKFFVNVYLAGLYLPTKNTDARAVIRSGKPSRVVMHFLREGVTKAQLTKAWQDGFRANSTPERFSELAARLAQFIDYFNDMHKGDVVWLDYLPGQGTRVTINGDAREWVVGQDFNAALLAVWLGKKPVTKSLKNDLLGD